MFRLISVYIERKNAVNLPDMLSYHEAVGSAIWSWPKYLSDAVFKENFSIFENIRS
jgi:hypothetical protein